MARSFLCMGLLTLAVGYAVLNHGGDSPLEYWTVSMLAVGLAGLTYRMDQVAPYSSRPDHFATYAALFFPAYVAFQLVPLPLAVLRIVSPARAAIAATFENVLPGAGFVPLSIAPPQTSFYLPRILGYVLIFLLVRTLTRRSPERPWALSLPLVVIGVVEAGLGLAQRATHAESVSGTYYNRDHFAGLLEMVLPFAGMYAAALFCCRTEQRSRPAVRSLQASCAPAAAAAIFSAIVCSLSRMGFISTLGSIFVMGTLAMWPRLPGSKRWIAMVGIAGAILLVFLLIPPQDLIARFAAVGPDDTRSLGRLPVWKDTLRMIAGNPLFGYGLGSYFVAFLRYQTTGLTSGWMAAHNDYLQAASELGIVGFLILSIVVTAVFLRAVRIAISGSGERRFLGLACAGALSAILIHSFADFNMYVTANAMTFWWIAGIAVGIPASLRDKATRRAPRMVSNSPFVLGALLVAYAGAWLIFVSLFPADAKAERLFCRFGVCDSQAALTVEQFLHRVNSAGMLPTAELIEFLRRDPAAPYRWSDLAEAMEREGRTGMARYCFSTALLYGPNQSFILVKAALFHLSQGENRKGLELMSRALEAGPIYDWMGIGTYLDHEIAVDDVLRYGLRDRRSYQAYLSFLISRKKMPDAQTAWDYIVSHSYSDGPLANQYVEFLVLNKNFDAATRAWAAYVDQRDKDYLKSNFIFNGGFEFDPVESRFDWKFGPSPGAKIDFNGDAPYSGTRSLRIQFDGTQNVVDAGLHNTVFLRPGRYRFQAYVRTQELSTDEGLSFQLSDPAAPSRLGFKTTPALGSSGWKPVEHTFEVPPGTGLLELRLVRRPSLRLVNLLHGTVWIDSVSITPER